MMVEFRHSHQNRWHWVGRRLSHSIANCRQFCPTKPTTLNTTFVAKKTLAFIRFQFRPTLPPFFVFFFAVLPLLLCGDEDEKSRVCWLPNRPPIRLFVGKAPFSRAKTLCEASAAIAPSRQPKLSPPIGPSLSRFSCGHSMARVWRNSPLFRIDACKHFPCTGWRAHIGAKKHKSTEKLFNPANSEPNERRKLRPTMDLTQNRYLKYAHIRKQRV